VPRKPDEDLYAIVRQHLEMSCSSGESEPEEPTLVIEAGPPDWSDVEPDGDHGGDSPHHPRVELPPPPVYNQPNQPIVIEEDQPTVSESTIDTESGELLSPTETLIEPLPPALSPMLDDPTMRRPTRPAKPHAPTARKAKAALTAISVAQPRPPSTASDSRTRTRIVPRSIVAERSLEFGKSISTLLEELTVQYQLNATEQKRCRKTLKAVRVGHKQLARHFREHFGYKCRDEESRGRYLDWLEDEYQMICAMDVEPDSDD